MLDKHIQKIATPALEIFAVRLKGLGISANQLTLGGFACGMFASLLIALGKYHEGLAFILLNRIVDGLDGARARLEKDLTARGGFLDILCDFIFYASVPLAFAFAESGQNSLVAALLLFSFIGTGSSFLAYANFTKRGLTASAKGKAKGSQENMQGDMRAKILGNAQVQKLAKALYYIGGITESSETTIFFVIVCLLPEFFPIFGFIFALLCLTTTCTRAYAGWRDFDKIKG